VGDLGHVELELCNRMGTLSSNNLYCLAIEGKHWDLVDAMINSNIQTIESLEHKLVASAKSGNVNLCRLFLEQGAKPKGVGNGELPPLFYAVQLDHTEMVSLLFNKGAKIPKHGNGEKSELHIAAKKGNIAIAQMLIENGADVNAINGNTEWAPVHEAAAGGKIEMCQFLVENYNCDLDCLTATGKRAFDLARIGGHSFLGAYLKNQWETQNTLRVESTDKHFEDEGDENVVNLDDEARCDDVVVDDIRKQEKPENDHVNDSQAVSMTVQESVTYVIMIFFYM
jgi:ankyrin repeat protein